jgi:DNA end-binding protein Ku
VKLVASYRFQEQTFMARPYWSGQITISLVTFGVKLFVATEAKSEIHFHMISRSTGERVRQQRVLASAQEAHEQGPGDAALPAKAMVQKDEIVKGYEYTKGQYVVIEPKELAELRVPSKHTMEIIQFVDEMEIDPEYYEKPYFVVPENDSQAQAFAVVRQALKDTKKVALSKIAFGGREHVVAITATQDDTRGGMMAYTMRYAQELRDPKEYFGDIKKTTVDEDSLDLAKQLIKRKTAKFDPSKFVDGYEVAVKELVQAKVDHQPIPKDEVAAPKRSNVVSLMDALKKSIAGSPSEDGGEEVPVKKKPATAAKGIALVNPAKAEKSAAKTIKPAKRKSA